MIRRISKHNDLKDLIKSCPSGVIDDIYAIEYYIQGYNTVIQANFTKKDTMLEVIIPSTDLETLPNGILMRRAYYKVLDASYPDGYYNLEFEDNMNVWIGDVESEPGPVPGEYVTEEELAETLADYATQDDLSIVQYSLERGIHVVQDQVDSIDVIVSDLSDNTSDLDQRVTDLEDQNNVQYNTGSPLYDGYNKVITTFEPGNSYCPLLILTNNEEGANVQYDGIKIDTNGVIYKYSANNIEYPGTWSEHEEELATQDWVQNQGYITSASLSGYATESWVENQGFAVDSPDDPIITESVLNDVLMGDDNRVLREDDLGPYAQMSWVQEQGYLDSSDLSGYATESWVGNQGYITSTALSGYATESWVQQQGYLTSSDLSGYATESWATNQFLEESKVWSGTETQWNALTPAQQASYTIALIIQ